MSRILIESKTFLLLKSSVTAEALFGVTDMPFQGTYDPDLTFMEGLLAWKLARNCFLLATPFDKCLVKIKQYNSFC